MCKQSNSYVRKTLSEYNVEYLCNITEYIYSTSVVIMVMSRSKSAEIQFTQSEKIFRGKVATYFEHKNYFKNNFETETYFC